MFKNFHSLLGEMIFLIVLHSGFLIYNFFKEKAIFLLFKYSLDWFKTILKNMKKILNIFSKKTKSFDS